jgi:hypothetical protein
MEFPTKCPLTGGKVGRIFNDCANCTFYLKSEKQCRIISIDNNLKTLLSIIQSQQKPY